jgi:hypothetical protein
VQSGPQAALAWEAHRLTGAEPLAVRASKKLRSQELLLPAMGPTILRKYMDDVPLWRGNHVAIQQLVDDFARYPYLPRLTEPSVLLNVVRDGVALITWEQDAFAYADSYDESADRYRGLRVGQGVAITDPRTPALVVKPDVARRQIDAEVPASATPGAPGSGPVTEPASVPGITAPGALPRPAPATRPRRYHGSVRLDTTRLGRDAGRIAEEVVAHLAGLQGAEVRVTLEIDATIPDGAPEQVVRIVTENGRTLKFTNHGFEEE